ncbi:type III toxin-antitoxin system TenpIN family toxin [Fusobacterium necrophorum subsp. funduliforme]
MKFYFLTQDFFNDYANCSEMEKKQNRPYANVCMITLNGLLFAIPIRSNIRHPYAIFSNVQRTKGLDLSKAVIINNPAKYLNQTVSVVIDRKEYSILEAKEKKGKIEKKLLSYIKTYKKALEKQEIPGNKFLCSVSCLQYFHKELGIE